MALASGGLGWCVPQVVGWLNPGFQTLPDPYRGGPLTGRSDSPLGGHPEAAAFGVIDDDRTFRITVLNPRGLWTALPPGSYEKSIQNARYDPDCLTAWHILLLARPPQGEDPGYTDHRQWRWRSMVEFGNTRPGTVETRLKRFAFAADVLRTPGPPAQCRL